MERVSKAKTYKQQDEKYREELARIYPQNQAALDKTLFAIPAVALTFVSAFFVTSSFLDFVKMCLLFAFGLFGISVVLLLFSYLLMNHSILRYLESDEACECLRHRLANMRSYNELVSWISAILTTIGLCFMFMAIYYK